MNTSTDRHPFSRVMVASAGGIGLAPLTRFARQFTDADARFRLVDIVCNPATLYPALILSYPDWCEAHRAMVHGAQASLRETADAVRDVVTAPDTELIDLTALRQGAAEALAHAAAQWHADLIAVAAHPCEHRRAGRVDPEELVASAHCPILYMPSVSSEPNDAVVRRVLVAIDGSDTALDALRAALGIAPQDARVKVVYAADDCFAWREWLPFDVVSQHRARVLCRGAAMLEQSRRPAEAALLDFDDDSGDASTAILAEAQRWQADLIVMGSHGMRGAPHPLPGHVTARTLRDASCAVLVCPRAMPPSRAGSRQDAAPAAGADETVPFYL
ncbi:universal stress protein [Paraburkholderia sp.]|uniref:universal stress protein n=1 Tax=Paraburkholderia sp. TaxID=1926495 RepID=UPI0039E67541